MEIPLTQGKFALIDDSDAELIARHRWYAVLHHGNWYARRGVWVAGRVVPVRMHGYLTGWPVVDHINGNGLDNRRCNLRPATSVQNAMNQRKNRGRNKFKGVYPRRRHWVAQIRIQGELLYLGYFHDEIAAALAYDAAAREHF